MTLPTPNLDDLRFQTDLVDEARKRIIRYCPEWTEYNLSDPGITLIELFAWMTELMVYRMNRIPEKNYLKFLEMLGLQRIPASSAATELTFWLSIQLPLSDDPETEPKSVTIPRGLEVRSESTKDTIVFTTSRDAEVLPPVLKHVRREQNFNKNYLADMSSADPFLPFDDTTPKEGDTFYLGFDAKNNIAGHLIRLGFTCLATEAVGIVPENPPWAWECLTDQGWQEITPSKLEGEKDTTGGLNNPNGSLVLYLPLSLRNGSVHGLDAFWLRCKIRQRDARSQGMYIESPRVAQIQTNAIGIAVPAMHSVSVRHEQLGSSNGEPGQSFTLQNQMILELQPGETLEVEESRKGEIVFVPWTQVDDFSSSEPFDRHFMMDMANGVVILGPSVRQANGSVKQYGRIPENGRRVRFSAYRFGGGVAGNLPIQSLTTLSSSLAYISRVSNLLRADGGRDQETIEELKLRAQRELQAQHRIVTRDDFEQFTKKYSRSIERARCLTPNESENGTTGAVSILVVPAVHESLRNYQFKNLNLLDEFKKSLRAHLDKYRLMTTSLHIREPRYIGVKVKATIIPQDFIQENDALQRVEDELKRYLTPIRMDKETPLLLAANELWEGWIFGRNLYLAEVMSLIQQVSTVKYVLDVEVHWRYIVPAEETTQSDEINEKPVSKIEKVLTVPEDGLLVSLNHDIQIGKL